MKSIKLNTIAIMLFMGISTTFAQTETKTLKVSGNCGMCKKTIEKAAKTDGVESADWNKETKMMSVTFDASKTSLEKIEKNVANAGYDNEGFKGDDKAYENLPPCCQYDRSGVEKVKTAVWPPLEETHMVMENIFHPFMMNDDLKPARENASKLLEKVKLMVSASNRPENITEAQLNTILANAQIYADVVANNVSNKKLKKSMMKFHQSFKEIVPMEMMQENMKKHGEMMKDGKNGKMHEKMMNSKMHKKMMGN